MQMRDLIQIVEQVEHLDELQGVKRHTEQDFQARGDVRRYMESQGFTCLGMGTYAAVFDHPSFNKRYVLRVFHDDNYETFISFCMSQQGNPHLPRFHGKLMKMGPAAMIRMERLEPMMDFAQAGPVDEGFERIEGFLTAAVKGNQTALDKVNEIAQDIGVGELVETILKCYAAMPPRSHFDVSTDNIMRRGSTLVITDPWWGAKKPFMR